MASASISPRSLGLIVNPIAGMGGRVGLKGTDGAALEQAIARGAMPVAAERTHRALARIERSGLGIRVLAAPAAMGADLARAYGFEVEVVGASAHAERTTPADTRAAAAEMARRSVDLLLFAGGDGTARDVRDAVGERVVSLGIPTGVKMHSGVFARTPEAAGELAATARPEDSTEAEVVDIDEDDRAIRLFGHLRIPAQPARVLAAKSSAAASGAADLDGACRQIAIGLDPEAITIVGPGSTTQRVLSQLGLTGTLRGVDVIHHGELICPDASEADLLILLRPGNRRRIVAGVIGGQGSLFGRGNQQISPCVLRAVGPENVTVVAALDKLLALDPFRLHVDTGDTEIDDRLTGYRRVQVAAGRTIMMEVST